MRLHVVLLASMLAGCAAPPPGAAPNGPLGLAGRVAGAPQRCVPIEQGEALRASQSDPHAVLYGTGRTIWVNHLGPNCGFHDGDALISHPIGSSYCRGDFVSSIDSFTHIRGPGCVLGEFVPYTR